MIVDEFYIRLLIYYIVFPISIDVDIIAPDSQLYIYLTVRIAIYIDAYVVLTEFIMELHVFKVDPVLKLVIKKS